LNLLSFENGKREDTLLGIFPLVVVLLDGLAVAEPVNQAGSIVAGEVIDHATVGLYAVFIQFGLGHVDFFQQIHDELVLFASDSAGIMASAIGGMVLAVAGWLFRWWRSLSRLGLWLWWR
jgi:hypothetical protein